MARTTKERCIQALVERDGHYCHYCGIPLATYGSWQFQDLPRIYLPSQEIMDRYLIPAKRGRTQTYAPNAPYWRSYMIGRASPEIDHMLPIRQGGAHDFNNLVLACRACNGHKHTKPYATFVALNEGWKLANNWAAILADLRIRFDYLEVRRG